MLARHRTHRRGMTIVETTLALGLFLLLLFGLFEYCRFLMVLHVTNNAARDGIGLLIRMKAPSVPIRLGKGTKYGKVAWTR